MDRNCELHTFELADGECRMCSGAFCVDCLLHPFGEDKPGLCKQCAITAGGLRKSAARQVRTKPEEKRPRSWLMTRLRGAVAPVEPEQVLSPEETMEREADEIAQMMADQRIPEPDEPEPEPVPLPENIAPPGLLDDVGDERPARRDDPQEVSGGLDLPNQEAEAVTTPADPDHAPPDPSAPVAPTAETVSDPPAEAVVEETATVSPPVASPAPMSRAPELFDGPPSGPQTPPAPHVPEPVSDGPTDAGAAESRGTPDAGPGPTDEPVTPTATAVTDTRPGSEAGGDVDELLRRIADLRGS
jgi:hypothetical protein